MEPNTTPCGSDNNLQDGCGQVFDRLPHTEVLCQLCKQLKQPGLSRAEIDVLRDSLTQCDKCGFCGTYITNPCGTCRRFDAAENRANEVSNDRHQAAQRRHAQVTVQMARGCTDHMVHAGSQMPTSTPQTGPATSQIDLNILRSNVGRSGVYAIVYEIRRSNAARTVDSTYGKSCLPFSDTITMLELKEQILNHFNPHWVEKHVANLQIWIQKYGQAETCEFYVTAPNSYAKKAKGTSLSVELYIDMDKYQERTDIDGEASTFGTELLNVGQKRKASASGRSSKRVKATTVPLTSSFAPT
ncbi:hypothetical protein BDN71DRAFT_1511019 [Pleurotus eryngii]|uniref:Uncharacterized protein n=1 Tax=Pleurotus eryngii TaxID=5323 RepID=A0A9P6DCI5_PLEER|nr:hypothetical protein BDN71DRAFT_1511019 [Pleurotus eryngii]